MAGDVGQAVITRTSKSGPPFERQLINGVPLPAGIAYAEMMRKSESDGVTLRWRTVAGTNHEMPYEHSEQGLTAVLIAMKLTC